MKTILSDFSFEELITLPEFVHLPKFRADQVYSWVHQKHVSSFSQMSNVPRKITDELDRQYTIAAPSIVKKQVSVDGTVKYLFGLIDGNCIETVVMKYSYGYSVCVSTQVGCAMGCRFCASTKAGRVRNLSAGEILQEIYGAERDLGIRVSHIVLMGIGEPLDNYDNVLKFLKMISNEKGDNIGMRNISLSSCGVVPMIDRLAEEKLQLTLSISLHAPFDEIRSSMMPINNAYNIDILLSACRRYQEKTGRRISFEYSMVKGVNDSRECARKLAERIKGMGAHVNLIPINPVDGSPYSSSDDENIRRFQKLLTDMGVNATIRRRLGTDISAACGQLRRETTLKN